MTLSRAKARVRALFGFRHARHVGSNDDASDGEAREEGGDVGRGRFRSQRPMGRAILLEERRARDEGTGRVVGPQEERRARDDTLKDG